MNGRLLAAGAGSWLVLWLPPVRRALESDMTLHMAVQVPLLIAVGLLVAAVIRDREPRWLADADWLGIPGIVAVLLGTSFWMLPRALDQAVSDPRADLIKFLSLPLLVGLPLGLSWRRMPPLGRAFIWANFIPKLGAFGGLYLGAPTRLCAYYRLDQQELAGWTLIAIALALGTTWFVAAFVGWTPSCATKPPGRRFECGYGTELIPLTLDGELMMSNSMDGSQNISRRAALTGTALAFVAAADTAITPADAQTKISQAAAKYQEQPKAQQSCAVCVNFQPPNACKFVQGTISPTGWCLLFAAKT